MPFTQGYKTAANALLLHHFEGASGTIWDDKLNTMAAYQDLVKHPDPVIRQRWLTSGKNEFGSLFQGYGTIEGMDVLDWVPRTEVPQLKKVTYPPYTADIRPKKSEPQRTRIIAGGD